MENSIQLFSYNEDPVRVIMLGEPPAPWWVAKDVCDILGYTNVTDTLNKHLDEDERNTLAIREGNRGNPVVNVINESGLYCLILRSNMPKAKEFRKWVTATVLPDVMRNGLPSSREEQPALPSGVIDGAKSIFEAAKIKDNQLALALDKIYSSYTGRSALQTAGIVLLAPTNNQLLNPTQIGKHFGVSARKINELLIEADYQRKTEAGYEPTELGAAYAVMQDTGKAHSNGTPIRQLKWDSSIVDELQDYFTEGR